MESDSTKKNVFHSNNPPSGKGSRGNPCRSRVPAGGLVEGRVLLEGGPLIEEYGK